MAFDKETTAARTPATEPVPAPPPSERAKMVGWYDPGQLSQTGVDVALSTIFGRFADHRLIEALATPTTSDYYDYSVHCSINEANQIIDETGSPRPEIWIDYAADVGDGWNSTYAIAYHLSRPLELRDSQGQPHQTSAGALLLFGGDEVYPVAERELYRQRLVAPYETAHPNSPAPCPHVFAIPGNHDWYDGLVAFTRLFCSGRWFAGWKTRQERSYFALKLPRGWWVIAPDVQLASDIDEDQVNYFRRVARHFEKDDRIILCNAEPHWIYAHIYGDSDSNISENNLAYLENRVLGRKVSVFVAGDLHHYRRHEATDGTQKITCGGGGAFLHPTSGPEVETLTEGEGRSATQAKALRTMVKPRTFVKKSAYPPEKTCRRLCWKNLAFPLFNPKFGMVTGALYLLTCWSALADLSQMGLSHWCQALEAALRAVVTSPPAVFWVAAIVGGFWLFTDTHSTRYRIIAGLLHGLTHLGAAFMIGWGAAYFCDHCLGFAFMTWKQMLTSAVLIFAGGWIAGAEIMGLYLLISLNVFKRHMNEAFSSLACQDYKSFLRMKIGADGALTIYPIGIDTVPRRWKEVSSDGYTSKLEPEDGSRPRLIEDPIVVKR